MSDTALRIFLPLYFVAFGTFCFFGRILWFRSRTGVNPLISATRETPLGFAQFIITVTNPAMGVVMFLYAASPELYERLGPFSWYGNPLARAIGIAVMLGALLLTTVAQTQMGASWRIGINAREKTAIVREGLFRYSRHPIYAGLILVAAGLFLVLPDPLTLVILVATWIGFQMLARVEEEHLRSVHGAAFEEYRARVPRWFLF